MLLSVWVLLIEETHSTSTWLYKTTLSKLLPVAFYCLLCNDMHVLSPKLLLHCIQTRWVKQEGELAKMEASQITAPKLDLSFKEGQTIKIHIGVRHHGIVVKIPL